MPIQLNTVEDALAQLVAIAALDHFDEEISFGGELGSITFSITGRQYHGSIPGELARGLWEYQEELYRAAAFALSGSNDIRKLSQAVRDTLELVFEVREGSTDILAKLDTFIKALGEGFITMESKHKATVLICLAIILGGGVLGYKALDDSATLKQEEVKASLQVQLEQEKTRQFQLFSGLAASDKVVSRFDKASEDGTRSVIRSASDAESIKVGRIEFDRSDIEEVNQRAARTASDAVVLDEDFRVLAAEAKLADSTKYMLASTLGEFSVIVHHSEFSPAELDKLWAAAKGRANIRLEVSVTKNRDTIKAAQIVSVY